MTTSNVSGSNRIVDPPPTDALRLALAVGAAWPAIGVRGPRVSARDQGGRP